MMTPIALRRAGIVALLLVFLPRTGFGQTSAVSGTVRDNTAVLPGAAVSITLAGRTVGDATTDATGTYRFTGLADGVYQISVALRGFETAVRSVTVGPSLTSPVDVTLAVGRVSTTLTVTALGGKATASRLPVPDAALPAQLSSIPQELMRQQATNSVADALKNASGVQAVRWYGVYEQYSMRGFFDPDRDGLNVVLVDGMRRSGNRYGVQTNNLESIEVLKGPASVLYGRGAVGGAINLVRKKPEATPRYDLSYRAGSFGTHQVSVGATGPVGRTQRLLYRLDTSVETSEGWRGAGSDRFSVSPSLMWAPSDRAQVTISQDFNRDRFDGDGGVPLNIITLPEYRRDLQFSLPQDNVLVEDSQTQVLVNLSATSRWRIRNSFLAQRTSDRYFVTEGVYGDPGERLVYREPLDFHHIRRPLQNQLEAVGTLSGFGRHTVLFGYEYQRDRYRTETTAGDDPDCLCGYWWLTIPPMSLTTLAETGRALDLDTIERRTFVRDDVHAVYWQDQIDLPARVKINVGGRFDDYSRRVTRTGGLPFKPQARDESAYSYRAGVVVEPGRDQQLYVSATSSFTPVTTIPPDGSALDPSTARNYEGGYRWHGLASRVDASAAVFHVVRDHLSVRQSVTRFVQVGEQVSSGLDVDVNANIGNGLAVLANYGFARPRLRDAGDLSDKTPRYVPAHSSNLWLRKSWTSGLSASLGARFIGRQFADDANTTRIEGYGLVSGAVGYRRDRWDWSVNVDNALNKKDYFLPGHFSNLVFPGAPFSVSSTIRLKLD